MLRFVEKTSFITVLGKHPDWDCTPHFEYISRTKLNITKIDKVQSKGDCVKGSILNGFREPIFYLFCLEKPPGFKILSEPETVHWKTFKNLYWEKNFLYRRWWQVQY